MAFVAKYNLNTGAQSGTSGGVVNPLTGAFTPSVAKTGAADIARILQGSGGGAIDPGPVATARAEGSTVPFSTGYGSAFGLGAGTFVRPLGTNPVVLGAVNIAPPGSLKNTDYYESVFGIKGAQPGIPQYITTTQKPWQITLPFSTRLRSVWQPAIGNDTLRRGDV